MIINRQHSVRVSVARLTAFLRRVKKVLRLPATAGDLTVCLVEDREIRRLNRTFRGKDKATDVLSFPSGGANGYLGDIAVSAANARRNARRYGRSLERELRILVLHGVLHLLGHDHEADNGEMDRLELRLRGRLGLD